MNYINRYFRKTLLLVILCSFIAGGMAGCTYRTIKPEFVTAPHQKYSIAAIGDIVMEDKQWDYLIPRFRHGLVNGLLEQNAFERVLDSVPESLPESALLLSGKILEVDKGSTALRWAVGFGAGRSKVRGIFEISGYDGKKLVKFEAQESYAGGVGIGGGPFLDIDDLMLRLGKTTAKKTVVWARGGVQSTDQPQPQIQTPPQATNTYKEQVVSASEYNYRGFEYYKNAQYTQAIENFNIALSMEVNPYYYINRGTSFYELKQYNKAIADFKQAITLAPDKAKAYGWCGNAYYASKSYYEASEYFSKAITIEPNNAILYLNRGYAYIKIGNKSMAASDFKKACELGNEDGCKQLKGLGNK